MSRLYDRLLAHGARSAVGDDVAMDVVMECLPHSPVIVASHVVDYYFRGTDQEYWNWREDFPHVAPPYTYLWLESTRPPYSLSREFGTVPLEGGAHPKAWGVLLSTGPSSRREVEEPIRVATPDDPHRYVHAMVFVEYVKGDIYGPYGTYVFGVREDGNICRSGDEGRFPGVVVLDSNEGVVEFAKNVNECLMAPFLLTTSLLNSGYAVFERNDPPPKSSKKHRRRYGRPLTSFYTLEMDSLASALEERKAG